MIAALDPVLQFLPWAGERRISSQSTQARREASDIAVGLHLAPCLNRILPYASKIGLRCFGKLEAWQTLCLVEQVFEQGLTIDDPSAFTSSSPRCIS